ncbi:hypothetical protein FRC07_008655 [Ceratobasidium sp. 392]|nr:hypothetical protein FRC07_008655 [Ceratobasidium sp. 392]
MLTFPNRVLTPTVNYSFRSRLKSGFTLTGTPFPPEDSSNVSFPHSSPPERFGQPLHGSHPHLIAAGELTPGIQAAEYHDRRRRLMDSLPAGSVVVSRAAMLKYMSGREYFPSNIVCTYKFRQASNFWYLTGIEEQNSAVILYKTSDPKGYRMHLFMRERDPHDELWNGPRTGVHQSRDIFGADEVSDINEFPRVLKSAIKKASHVYADLRPYGDYPSKHTPRRPSKTLLAYLARAVSSPEDEAAEDILKRAHPQSLLDRLTPLRRIKSLAERKLMRQAGDISGAAHAKTMRFAKSANSEAQLAAHFEYLCALKGAQRPAYVPVVASGSNALIIHYTNNDCLLKEGELVLMDAGCEFNGYASDITRTFPVRPSGSFSAPQKELYAAVLSVQKELTALCTESARESLNSLHAKSVDGLGKALTRIGFDLGPGNRRLDRLYPHFLSHPIGIDLHETNGQRHHYLQEGQVVTIEPGVYVPPDPAFPKWFHNIGIRIEDEVLVERDLARVLTVNAPKEIADIEAVCQGLIDVGPY